MSVDTRLAQLVSEGRFGEALHLIQRSDTERRLTIEEQVIQAELLADLASSDAALELALYVANKPESKKSDRARCLAVAGAMRLRAGGRESGLEFFKRAQSYVKVSPNRALECRVHLSWLGALVGWVSPEAASSELAAARWLVNAAGESQYTTRFHLILAEMEAKRGLLSRARHHLAVSAGLLDRFPHLFMSAELFVRSAAVALLSSDLSVAIKDSCSGLNLSKECDAISLEVVARSNLGHALLSRGQLDSAADQLGIAHRLCRVGGGAEIGILDGLMQLSLVARGEEEIDRRASQLNDISAAVDNGHSYYGLWHALTRIRWLYRGGQSHEGTALALDAIPRVAQMADRHLLERMRLLGAEGLARTGRIQEGAALMADAILGNPDPPLEMLAEASRVAGRLAATDQPAAARSHFERASRILAAVGNATARGETIVTAGQAFAPLDRADGLTPADAMPTLYRLPRQTSIRLDATSAVVLSPREAVARAVEGAGAAIDLAMHPALLGHELMQIMADAGAADVAALVDTRDGAAPEILAWIGCDVTRARTLPRDADVLRVPLGTGHGRTCEIAIAPPTSPAARGTLLAVERLAHAALELHHGRERERERAALWPQQTTEQQLGMVFASESMLELVKTTRRVATTNVTVLITGETGTGKELLARALHLASPRHEHPFVPFNCTAVAREMIDAQLFGYRRGAFTGAHEAFPGVIRAAAGGTLFLDEIGEIGLDVQPKLLRFLEAGEVHPLGEARPSLADVRIVAATNADLDRLVSEGRFREDLFYRLDVIRLQIPPLRERREEIPILVEHFLSKYSQESKKTGLVVAEETMEYLVLYRWPGNVRQLANELHRLVALAESGAILMPEHLSRDIATSRKTVPASQRDLAPTELVVRIDQPMSAAVEHLERAMIQDAMRRTDSRVEDASRLLGVSRKGLYLKRQRLGLD